MNNTRVKICGITRLADVHAAVSAGVDALGFVFTPRSKRCLELESGGELAGEVPAFVSRVGLFMDQPSSEVETVLRQVPLTLLQFHGQESGDYCRQFGLPYLKAVSMNSGQDLDRVMSEYPDAAALLLDSHEPGGVGGTGMTFDWDSIPPLSKALVLAGGLTAANVAQAVARVKPWAVDVSSGVEDAPGLKNEQKMIEFINEAKREF